MTTPIVWSPDASRRERARLTQFLRQCGEESYLALHRRAAADPAWFTGELVRFLDVTFEPPYREVLDESRGTPWARWFPGGGLNISQTCLAAGDPKATAIVWEGEEGISRAWSYRALAIATRRGSGALRRLGIGKGDAVGVHLPMMPETAAVMLALARIGAVAVPLFTGYGPEAIAERLRDVGAVAVVTANAFPRRGRVVDSRAAVESAAANCPALRHILVVDRMEEGPHRPLQPGRVWDWAALCEEGGPDHVEPTEAGDPLLILYTSGTTGRPKGVVHAHCGFPLKAAADMAFGFDVGPRTRIAWVTDIGWMMGPWLIYGALLLGGTAVFYDGAPDHPHPAHIWAVAGRQALHVLGVSPTLIRALSVAGDEWTRHYPLDTLQCFGSTGEPWNPAPWHWLFQTVGGGQIPIINYSGGTEISGGILCDNPLFGVKPCGFAAPCLGIDADVVNEQGESVRGDVGELVIRKPWLGMAQGFHGDPERYLDTYWRTFPGVWRHGDFARVDEDGYWFIDGRSDDTLNVGGKRVGPAEVESLLVAHPGVREAAVTGLPDGLKGTAIAAFVVPNGEPAAGLEEELREAVARGLGKPFRPEVLRFVRAVPKTRNGKLMRRLLRAAWLGEPPGNTVALEDPAVLDEIRGLSQK